MRENLLIKLFPPFPLILLLFYFPFVWNMWIWNELDHSLVGFGLVRTFVLYIFKCLEYICLPRLCFQKFTLFLRLTCTSSQNFTLFLRLTCTSSQNFNMMLPKRGRVCLRLSAQMSLLYPHQAVITLGILLPM